MQTESHSVSLTMKEMVANHCIVKNKLLGASECGPYSLPLCHVATDPAYATSQRLSAKHKNLSNGSSTRKQGRFFFEMLIVGLNS